MKRILAVFAHPDDETAVAGTLSHYADQGAQIGLVCATKGEAGEISDPSLATPENLAEVREQELRCFCDLIGVKELFMLGYCDSGMQGTLENEKPTAFIRAPSEDVQRKLVRIYREFKPDAIITFEPFGWYGHPDHIAAGRHATQAFHLSGSKDAFPDTGAIWQARWLYHAVMPRGVFKQMTDIARKLGIDLGGFDNIAFDGPDPLADQITHEVDVSHKLDLKDRAPECHKTQFGEDNIFRRLPKEVLHDMWQREHFIQVSPLPEKGDHPPYTELFLSAGD